MLREKGATSLQAVVFDSPLVSLRARNEREGGTSNTFVGITLYDKENNIIKECNTSVYKYFNTSDDKIISFKSSYPCPPDYSNLNSTTNECLPFPIKMEYIPFHIIPISHSSISHSSISHFPISHSHFT